MVSAAPLSILVHEWVTGGGLAGRSVPRSWAAEGLAMRRAIASDFAALREHGVRVQVTVDPRWPDDHSRWTTLTMEPEDPQAQLAHLARQADCTVLIAPETMGVLELLAGAVEATGTCWLGSSAAAIRLTADKAKLAARLAARQVQTPSCRIVVPAEGLPADAAYPAVLKPVDGAGAIDTYFIARSCELPDAARALPIAVLQPYFPGVAMSGSFLVGDGGICLVATGQQDVVRELGRFTYRGGTIPVPCRAAEPILIAAIEAVPGLRGFVGVDFVWQEQSGAAAILEINPRPTTSLVGLVHLLPPGRLAAAWLAACGVAGYACGLPAQLASHIRTDAPVRFLADGTICARAAQGTCS